MTNELKRKLRVEKVLNTVQKCDPKFGADKEKLIAMLGFEFGVSRRTALEYINILVVLGKIRLDGKNLYAEVPSL